MMRARTRMPRASRRFLITALLACTCVLTLVMGSEAASATLPTATVTVTAPAQVLTGATAALSAAITNPATPGEVVYLDLYNGSAWTPAGSVTAGSSSTAALGVGQGAPGTYYYRLRIAATGAHAESDSAVFGIKVVNPPIPGITVSAPAQTTTDATATITASLTSVPAGETVYLDRLSGTTAVAQTSARVTAGSTAVFAVQQTATGTYAYRVRVLATGTHQAATGSWFTITVGLPTPVLTITGPAQIPPGAAATLQVTISQASVGNEIVELEQATGSTWTAVSSTTTASDGTAALRVTQALPGQYTYRVRLAATTLHNAGTSASFGMQVTADATAPGATSAPPAPTTCGGAAPVKPDGRSWVCTYDDEFNGTTLDRRYWVPQVSATSGFYTGTTSNPACVIDDPQTIAVTGGDLQLNAKVLDTPIACGTATTRLVSGMVMQNGTFSQTYGKYEIRAELPAWTGKGLQETFWLWPNDVLKYGGKYPSAGEIDLAEFYSNVSAVTVPTMHYLFDPSTMNLKTGTNVFSAQNCLVNVGAFNTYGLEWSPGQLKVFVNDKLCLTDNYVASNATAANPYAPFDSPFFLSLTQGFGTTGNEFDPDQGPKLSTTLVDYVRVWA
ncbi:MAG: glycoside hydrolase family 16 protein [Marmoricola sp.]|nr:glycoside hydrolase family 16 protein [Marmoricola sp.]